MLLDSPQKRVEKKLKELALSLENQSQEGFFKKLIAPKNSLKSLYIHGDVGRGKSMLMKSFFNSLHKTSKVHFHFNSFMRLIHEGLRDVRREEKKFSDELIESVKRVVQKNKVICLDEFQVLDVADAMLLSRIFAYLFVKNIVVVFTSNSAPQNLYQNGLQREIFLQFIEQVLLVNCQVLHLDSPTDYRAQLAQAFVQRYFINNQANRQKVSQMIENLVGVQKTKTSKKKVAKIKSTKINVWGREVTIEKTFDSADCKKIAIFTFAQLCQTNFGAADYQAICQNFDLIFLLKLPKLMSEDADCAKRLTLFIDEIYENKTALIVLAKIKSTEIYKNGIACKAFKRTVSRFNEIKSDQYWQSSKFNLQSS